MTAPREFACVITDDCDSIRGVSSGPNTIPDDVDALKAALIAERTARQELEARASGAEAMVAHLKLMIAKLKRDRFGPSAERGRKLLDQLEMQLEELETAAAEDEEAAAKSSERRAYARSPAPSRYGRHCQPICRASAWWFRRRAPARAAAASSPNWARRSPRHWRAVTAHPPS